MRQGGAHRRQIHFSIRSQQHHALHYVAQCTDISRPRVILQRGDGIGREGNRLPTVLRAYLAGEVLDQRRDIFAAFTQRRQNQRHHVDAMK